MMYRVYEKSEAIKRIQSYLRVAGSPDIFVAPSGIYDDNTRTSVKAFQAENGLEETGEVDRATFDKLFLKFTEQNEINRLNSNGISRIKLPIFPDDSNEDMIHINQMMSYMLNYYRQTHRIRISRYYSEESQSAVNLLRKIYMLPEKSHIDEEFYLRLLKDYGSINIF